MLALCDPAPETPHAPALALLDRFLAAAIDLHRQVKHAQWNLEGPDARAILPPLETAATALEYCCDLIVAHAGLLGGAVNGTIQAAAARSFLPSYPLNRTDARAHARALIAVMEMFAGALRDGRAQDRDTAALLIEIARCIERQVWLLAATVVPADRAARQHDRPRRVVGGGGCGRGRDHLPDRRSGFAAASELTS